MEYKIKVNKVEREDSSIKGYATIVFGDSLKVGNIHIMENQKTGDLFVSMPRYKTSEVDEKGFAVFKDVCNPTTKEFHKELTDNILEQYQNGDPEAKGKEDKAESPRFTVRMTPFEREGSNVKALGTVVIENVFAINNVSIHEGKEGKLFVSMPSYRTNQVDENGKPVYQDIAYPITKDFREKLYGAILKGYDLAKENRDLDVTDEAIPALEEKQEKEPKKAKAAKKREER